MVNKINAALTPEDAIDFSFSANTPDYEELLKVDPFIFEGFEDVEDDKDVEELDFSGFNDFTDVIE